MVSCSGNNRVYNRVLIMALAILLPLLAVSSVTAQSAKTGGTDPLVGFRFALTSGGKEIGYFQEVAGIGSEIEVVEHKVLTAKGAQTVQKIPGRVKWLDVTLKRGLSSDISLWEWHKQVEDGDVKSARKNFSIIMYDENLAPVAQWDFINGWPSKIEGPKLQGSTTSEIGIESLTLVHEGMSRSK